MEPAWLSCGSRDCNSRLSPVRRARLAAYNILEIVRITRHDLHPLVLFAGDFRNAPARERYCHGASTRSFGLPTRKPHRQAHYQSLPAVVRPRLFRLLEDAGSSWTNSAGKGRSTSRGWVSQCQPPGHSPGERVFRLAKSEIAHNKEITALGKHHCTPLTSVRNRSTFEANTGNI
jgi:hypothetical protein